MPHNYIDPQDADDNMEDVEHELLNEDAEADLHPDDVLEDEDLCLDDDDYREDPVTGKKPMHSEEDDGC